MAKRTADRLLEKAKSHEAKREPEEARKLYEAVLETAPGSPQAQRAFRALLGSRKRAMVLDPPKDALQQIVLLYNQKKLPAVVERAGKLAQQFPSSFVLWNIIGAASAQLGQLDRAIEGFRKASELNPEFPDAYNNLGNACKAQGKLGAAVASFARALALKPDFAQAHNNLGIVLQDQGRLEAAIERFKRAIKLKPDYAGAHNNLGSALRNGGRSKEAIACYQRAIKFDPKNAETHRNLGGALQKARRIDEAIASYKNALAIAPDYADVETRLLHQQQHICDWQDHQNLPARCETLGVTAGAVPVFATLSMEDHPERQMLRARTRAAEKYTLPPLAPPAKPSQKARRLRIGYFSADFHDHATLYLMRGQFQSHDRTRFDVYAYSYGNTKTGEMREQVARAVHTFTDVSEMSDRAIADLARAHELDIAIDLKGYTADTRSALFQYRLAPVQINYLGFPGTMGADFIDYIIADPTVIPDPQRQFYTEKAIFLPDTYFPCDGKREIAETTTTRADFGLPEEAFVFCCFNNNYKISPREFDIWMRVLGKVEDSVLWLLKSNRWAEQNLRKEAAARGIDPARLVFAERQPHSEHLARHKHADLFVDTFNYNAHTTATDALWGRLPLVTKTGQQFAARVSASLLGAVGLPELITETEEDYEALILELATNPERLSGIRRKLAANRTTMPLFDTELYTRNFETGLQMAYDRYFEGKAPADIIVPSSA
ncbi:MAG: tetratricopeptide repeat protein [Paracoccaceae bacterium]